MPGGSVAARPGITSYSDSAKALVLPSNHSDMTAMNTKLTTYILAAAMAVSIGGGTALAQIIAPPINPALIVPLPAAPPPPRIDVPVVPKMDVVTPPRAAQSRPSFGQRITDCLQDGAAAGLNSSDRAVYSRNCANR